MKKFALTLTILCAFCALAYTGERYSGKEKEMIQQAPPECDFYRAHEWDLMLWATYAFSANTGRRDNLFGDFRTGGFDGPNHVEDSAAGDPDEVIDIGHVGNDRFLNRDGAWGGGADAKYFFSKYWALGAEGFVLDANDNTAGAALATFTFRWPIGCSRFAPYVWGGVGVANGGSHTVKFFNEIHHGAGEVGNENEEEFRQDRTFNNTDSEVMGQFGGGLEIRITRHVGFMGDFAWNVLNDPDNDFGLARVGLTLSY
jgi:hypothetical protein